MNKISVQTAREEAKKSKKDAKVADLALKAENKANAALVKENKKNDNKKTEKNGTQLVHQEIFKSEKKKKND